MPACRYVEENCSAATKRLAGVALEVNLKECISRTPPSSANKASHSGFENHSRPHKKFKTRVSLAPQE